MSAAGWNIDALSAYKYPGAPVARARARQAREDYVVENPKEPGGLPGAGGTLSRSTPAATVTSVKWPAKDGPSAPRLWRSRAWGGPLPAPPPGDGTNQDAAPE